MFKNTITADRFSIVTTLVGIANSGDWEGFMATLPDTFVFEFVVFDGPNLCFSRRAIKEHFDSIPGFKLGEYKLLQVIEGDDKVFLHLTTTTRFMIASPPGDLLHELFFVVHVKGGHVTRLQMSSDSKTVAEIKLTPDAV